MDTYFYYLYSYKFPHTITGTVKRTRFCLVLIIVSNGFVLSK